MAASYIEGLDDEETLDMPAEVVPEQEPPELLSQPSPVGEMPAQPPSGGEGFADKVGTPPGFGDTDSSGEGGDFGQPLPPGAGPPGTPVHPRVADYPGQVHGESDPFQQSLHNQLRYLEGVRQQLVSNPLMYTNGRPSAHLQAYLAKIYEDAGNLVTHSQRGGKRGQNYLFGQGWQATQPQYTPQQKKRLAEIERMQQGLETDPKWAGADMETIRDAQALLNAERKKVGPPRGAPGSLLPPDRQPGNIYTHPMAPGVLFSNDHNGNPKVVHDPGKGAGKGSGGHAIKWSDVREYMDKTGESDPKKAAAAVRELLGGGQGTQGPSQQPGAPATQQGMTPPDLAQRNRAFDARVNDLIGQNVPADAAADIARREQQEAPAGQQPAPVPLGKPLTQKEHEAAHQKIAQHVDKRIHDEAQRKKDDAEYKPTVTNENREQVIKDEMKSHGLGESFPDYLRLHKQGGQEAPGAGGPVTEEKFYGEKLPSWRKKAEEAGNDQDKRALARMEQLAQQYGSKGGFKAMSPQERGEFIRGLVAARRYDPTVQISSRAYVGAELPGPAVGPR